jgi:hypothetical protein
MSLQPQPQKLWFFYFKKNLQNEETRKEVIFIGIKFVSKQQIAL